MLFGHLTGLFVGCVLLQASVVSCHAGENRSRLLIVGAGVSGLGAATRLLERGFSDFKILEAENRIGGRVHSVPFGEGVMIDYGAHWVGGGQGNPVYDLAAPLGLVEDSEDSTKEFLTVFSNGDAMDTRPVDILDFAYNSSANDLHGVSVKEVIINGTRESLDKLVQGEKANVYLDLLIKMECAAEGCDNLDDVSARLVGDYKELNDSRDYGWKGKGYQSIIDLILNRHPKSKGPPIELGDRLLLNSEVKSIKVLESGGVQVECSDGGVHLADLVLVTVSVGVLKNGLDSLFIPPLPAPKQAAIKATGLGTVDKIIVRFPTTWWPANYSGVLFLWLQKEKDAYKSEYSWETEIFLLQVEKWSPFSLTVWLIGDAAREMERTPLDGVKRASMRVLRHFLGTNYTIPEPVEVIRSKWGTNPHFLGSWSYRNLQAEKHNVSHIATPLSDREGREVVFFGGEATHPYFYGTVHGALASGWREAERILGRISAAAK